MAASIWDRKFDEPIPLLPRGCQLVTLRDAGNYILKLPEAEHTAPEWQAAMEALDARRPEMFARIGMMQAINRHHQHRTEPRRKATKKYRIVRRRT